MRQEDFEEVAALLGRSPKGPFEIVTRRRDGRAVVIKNSPYLGDGTPMPTIYWLVGREEREAVSRLEAGGGVRAAASAVDPGELDAAHARYAEERDGGLASPVLLPRPSGGVGGTRKGVKCLHAHLAWHLAGGDDPVGRWTAREIGIDEAAYITRRES